MMTLRDVTQIKHVFPNHSRCTRKITDESMVFPEMFAVHFNIFPWSSFVPTKVMVEDVADLNSVSFVFLFETCMFL